MNVIQVAPPRGRRSYMRGRLLPNAQRVTNIFPKYRKYIRINTGCRQETVQTLHNIFLTKIYFEFTYFEIKSLDTFGSKKKIIAEIICLTFNEFESKSILAAIFAHS